jgi:hypothetical protein
LDKQKSHQICFGKYECNIVPFFLQNKIDMPPLVELLSNFSLVNANLQGNAYDDDDDDE